MPVAPTARVATTSPPAAYGATTGSEELLEPVRPGVDVGHGPLEVVLQGVHAMKTEWMGRAVDMGLVRTLTGT
ncbi:hypothetical protein GCM10009623_16040 [Nocardioides aestuarii]